MQVDHPVNQKDFCCFFAKVDFCMFHYPNDTHFTQKPTRLLHNTSWISDAAELCDKSHVHVPMLRGNLVKAASAYPVLFCQQVAMAYVLWAKSDQ
jgi:hypothetical protein